MLSESLRARALRFRSPKPTPTDGTRRRRPVRSVLAGSVVSLLVASGLIAAGGMAASAHDRTVSADCAGIQVDLVNYQVKPGEPGANSLSVDAGAGSETISFDTGYSGRFAFADASVPTSWTVTVTAWDDGGPGDPSAPYSLVRTGTSEPCAAPAPAPEPSDPAPEPSDPAPEPEVPAEPEPQPAPTPSTPPVGPEPTLELSAVDCLADRSGERGEITATFGSLEIGERYSTVVLLDGAPTDLGGGFTAADSTRVDLWSDLVVGGAYSVTLLGPDGYEVESAEIELQDCPAVAGISLDAAGCAPTGGTADLTISLSGLVVGSAYVVAIDGEPLSSGPVTAEAEALEIEVPIGAGEHTVTLADASDDSLIQSVDVVIEACVATPSIDLSSAVCTTPGAAADLTVGLGQLVEGRTYLLTVVQELDPEESATVRVVGTSGPAEPVVFRGLVGGADYVVTVTDTQDARSTATATATVETCPGAPHIGMIADECSALGQGSDIHLDLFDLAEGESYDVVLERLERSTDIGTEVDRIEGLTGDGRVTFRSVGAGSDYRISVIGSDGTDILSPRIALHPCDVPGSGVGGVSVTADDVSPAPVPTDARPTDARPTLAQTGGEPVLPAVMALLVLLLGMTAVGTGALRRRRSS